MASFVRHVTKRNTLKRHLHAQFPLSSTTSRDEVVVSSDGTGGVKYILLNRPKALNAFNVHMVKNITKEMKEMEADSSVRVVVMEGAGDKAFCAGGDIRATGELFRYGYTLNHLIGTYKKPFIAIKDGITLGGGVSMSVHGDFGVATEHTLLAMPETFIGLFPDAGGSYFLPRLTGSLGMYLALTGHRLKARDVLLAGLATHFIPTAQMPMLKDCLSKLCSEKGKLSSSDPKDHTLIIKQELDTLHQKFCTEHAQSELTLAPHMETINRCFDQPSMEGIVEALENEKTEWAKQQLKTLSKMSPTSLKITYRQLTLGAQLSFAECFKMEYRMSQACMAGKDFYEGVRAVLVDRDNSPQWTPAILQDVTDEFVDQYFARLPEDKELQL
ncbi:3-hydroxyisobutyryl-CoA hydrolase, mitochondrial-like isoform X2 [Halichondria panicea]|uniref:3-hydroxyisobutyryl-CoA hydrolase, mitochondrial-like isoform X2 n=1 Tax=Halichondria panicea TaxID=6063 RepID=UPI00312B3FB3